MLFSEYSSFFFLQFTCDKLKVLIKMNTTTPNKFEFSFLEEGFSARDIVEQKINESSLTVSIRWGLCNGQMV